MLGLVRWWFSGGSDCSEKNRLCGRMAPKKPVCRRHNAINIFVYLNADRQLMLTWKSRMYKI